MLRKIGIIAVLTLLVTALAAVPALAVSPHFLFANASTNSSGALVVSFKEAGLGNITTTPISVSTDFEVTYGCFNGGGKHPQAANKETFFGDATVSDNFPVRNGQTTGSLTVPVPGPGDFACSPGQRLRLISVTYSNITITGAAGTISTTPSTLTFPTP